MFDGTTVIMMQLLILIAQNHRNLDASRGIVLQANGDGARRPP